MPVVDLFTDVSVIEVNIAVSSSDCRCNLTGTVNGSNVCNKLTGQCPCKELLTGRTCNKCQVGSNVNLMTSP